MSDHEPDGGGLEGPADELADDPEVTALLRALDPVLRDPAVWSEPPPGLADSIVAAIGAERAGGVIAAERTDPGAARTVTQPQIAPDAAVAASPHRDELSQARAARAARTRRAIWPMLAAAAAVVLIAVGVVVTRSGGDEGGELAIGPTDLVPGASATAVVNELPAGVAIELEVDDLPPAPDGQYYAGWVRSEAGELVGIGSFHMRGGDSKVTLWSGVPIARYPTLTVTIQTEGEGEASSGQVVLRGSLVD